MAKGKIMIQIQVTEIFNEATFVPTLDIYAVESLDGDSTIVNEISGQNIKMISSSVGSTDISDNPFCRLYLAFPDEPIKILNAPSFVSSPAFPNAGNAVLEIVDLGVTFSPSGSGTYIRKIAGHAYLNEYRNGLGGIIKNILQKLKLTQ